MNASLPLRTYHTDMGASSSSSRRGSAPQHSGTYTMSYSSVPGSTGAFQVVMYPPPAGGSLQPASPMRMAPQLPMMMMMIGQQQQQQQQVAVKPHAQAQQQQTAAKPAALQQQQQIAVEPTALWTAVPPVTAAVLSESLEALHPLPHQPHSCTVLQPVPAVASAGATENDAEPASVAAAAVVASAAGGGGDSYASEDASTADSPRIMAGWPAGYVFVMGKNGATGENMVAEQCKQLLEKSIGADQLCCGRLSSAATKQDGYMVPPICVTCADVDAAVAVREMPQQLFTDQPVQQPQPPIEFKNIPAELPQLPSSLNHSDDHVSEAAPISPLPLTLVRPQPCFREWERDTVVSPVDTSFSPSTSLGSSELRQGLAAGAAREAVPVTVSEVILQERSPTEAGAGGVAAAAEGGGPADQTEGAPADGVKAVEVELQVGMRGKGLQAI